MSSQELLREYKGQIVPQSYNAGLVALSWLVSLVGAGSTLELINRRTSFRGLFNHLLLVGSAVTMGGVAIWCMHFIGNRAIELANGEPEMQIAYSSGFTAISFFVPIVVLLAAFLAVGTNNIVSWWRVVFGGVLCGAAVCGMHYLGNASIENYSCTYRTSYVIGSAIIAVVASNVALAIFFVFRAMWANSWWKRAISAVVLAGAVSGMHWCAAVGTRYRLKNIRPEGNEPSRSATVVVVICLSIGACLIIAISAILRARNMRKTAARAQKITLGAAVFDKGGRILIDPDGFIPSTVVTDSFLEKNTKEAFSTGHPLFHWMFHASRNWSMISTLVGGMRRHVAQLPHFSHSKDGRHGIQLISEHGEMIDNYDVIFRELFCLAGAALADRFREDLTSVGVLWDEIIPTGANGKLPQSQQNKNARTSHGPIVLEGHENDRGSSDMAEKGMSNWQGDFGRGSLMLLIQRLDSDRDAERFVSAGFRFAEPHQVSDLIQSSMQIQTPDFETKLRSMSTYTAKQNQSLPRVHLGFFAVRARVSSGFEILVRKGARQLLPSMALPISSLESWHTRVLKRLENLTMYKILHVLKEDDSFRQTPQESAFVDELSDTIKALRAWAQEPLFEEAVLTSTVVRVPCSGEQIQSEATMIAMRLVIPIHSVLTSPNCEFVPLSFFKTRQMTPQFQQEFTREVHQEFGHVVKLEDRREGSQSSGVKPHWMKFWPFGHGGNLISNRWNGNNNNNNQNRTMSSVSGQQFSTHESSSSSSTVNLCPAGNANRSRSIDSVDDSGSYATREHSMQPPPPSYGGIMVFQEITIDVQEQKARAEQRFGSVGSDTLTIEPTNSTVVPASGIELQSIGHIGTNVQVGSQISNNVGARKSSMSHRLSFVDVLFAETVESR